MTPRDDSDWEKVPVTKVLEHRWDEMLRKWIQQEIFVKIAPKPFGRGSLRMSYYCLNLGDDARKISSIGSPSSCKDIDPKNDTERNNSILFNKLIGNKNVFGGRYGCDRCVSCTVLIFYNTFYLQNYQHCNTLDCVSPRRILEFATALRLISMTVVPNVNPCDLHNNIIGIIHLKKWHFSRAQSSK